MGFFYRKSINFGLFRINFSKSGIGISTGVKGARVSFGPTGKYITLGRKGFYYKKSIGKIFSKTNIGNQTDGITTNNISRATSNESKDNNNMKYLKIFGIFPSLLILGFITYKCFEVVDTIENYETFATIKNSVVNIRDNPTTNSKILFKSHKGDKFKFVEANENNWNEILSNGETAFVHGDFVNVKEELVSSVVIRRYDENPNTRYSIMGLCFVPLLFWNIFLYRVDKKNLHKQNINSQNMQFNNLITRAESLKESDRFQDAIGLYKEALSIDTNSSECYFGIASCHFNLSNDDDSISYYKKGLAIDPDNAAACFNLALVYYYSNQENNATAYFKKVLAINNSDGRAHYFAAMLEKDDYMSIDHMEKALKGDLQSKERDTAKKYLQMKYILVGTLNAQDSKIEKAKSFFNNALKFDSIQENKKAYEVAGDTLKSNGAPDLAIKFYNLAGTMDSNEGNLNTSSTTYKFAIKKGDEVELINGSKGTIIKYSSNSQITLDTGEVVSKDMIKKVISDGYSPSDFDSKNIFSNEYYELLLDFSKQLATISNKLTNDETLIEKIKDSLTESTTDSFIPYCILYDFCQILKILSNGNIAENSLETYGLTLVSPILTESTDVLSLGYELVANNYSKGSSSALAETLIEISEKNNPLNISVQDTKDNQVISTQKFQSNLSLPTALKIIDHPMFDEYTTILYRFANILSKADNVITKDEEETLKGIYQITHNPLPEEKNNSLHISDVNKNETLNEVLNELDTLIGLDGVKQEVKSLINYIKIQKEREKVGLKSSQVSYHCVFTGSPGTGKTTIARIVAKIYLHLGVLKKGQLVETDRSGLVAEYTGQTAVKVNKTVNSALDGVLFIDEAYSLIGANQDDFGKEAVATLIKRMEDDRDKLIVILAGYTDEMKTFIETNPGFKSRFNRYIEFVDYTPIEMESIFKLQCRKLDYKLTDETEKKLAETLNTAYANRDNSFGNGRFVRNIFEKTLERQANRIASVSTLTKEILTTIIADDIPAN